jgi:hypothetical protein
MFINNKPPPEYDNKLPLVNTRVITPKIKENITLSCNTIYRSYATDYKGNIPGEIKFLEPPPPPNDTEELDPNDPTVTPPPPPSGPGGGTPQGPGGGQPVL